MMPNDFVRRSNSMGPGFKHQQPAPAGNASASQSFGPSGMTRMPSSGMPVASNTRELLPTYGGPTAPPPPSTSSPFGGRREESSHGIRSQLLEDFRNNKNRKYELKVILSANK